MTDTLSPTVLELRRAFSILTKDLDKPLPVPVINTPNKDRRRKGWSWYTPDTWNSQTEILASTIAGERAPQSKAEICIAAEALGFPSVRILTELTHQIAHHYNYIHGIKDTSCGLPYDGQPIPHPRTIEGWHHNQEFYHTAAGMFGLLDGRKDATTGEWKFALDDLLREKIASISLDPVAFDLDRRNTLDYHPGSRQILWECQCRHPFKIRAARDLQGAVRCLNCDSMFTRK